MSVVTREGRIEEGEGEGEEREGGVEEEERAVGGDGEAVEETKDRAQAMYDRFTKKEKERAVAIVSFAALLARTSIFLSLVFPSFVACLTQVGELFDPDDCLAPENARGTLAPAHARTSRSLRLLLFPALHPSDQRRPLDDGEVIEHYCRYLHPHHRHLPPPLGSLRRSLRPPTDLPRFPANFRTR